MFLSIVFLVISYFTTTHTFCYYIISHRKTTWLFKMAYLGACFCSCSKRLSHKYSQRKRLLQKLQNKRLFYSRYDHFQDLPHSWFTSSFNFTIFFSFLVLGVNDRIWYFYFFAALFCLHFFDHSVSRRLYGFR